MGVGITTIDLSRVGPSSPNLSNGSSQGIPSLVRFVGAEGLSLEAADKEAIGSNTPVRSPQAQDAVAFVSTSVL